MTSTAPDTGTRWTDNGTYRRAWDRARKAAFDATEYASPLGRRPYDLRHACLSIWLNWRAAPAQVAEWAGHSVEVLLRTYVRCLDGQHDIAKRRIMETLNDPAGMTKSSAPHSLMVKRNRN